MCEPLKKPDSPNLEGDLILDQRERKFLLDAHTAFSFWEIATSYLRPHRPELSRPLAYVRTTYFDTDDFAYFRGHASPTARRLRVREYASAADPHEVPELTGECVVELKQSSAGRRSKSRVKMRPADVSSYLARYASVHHDSPLSPCMTSWYQRSALTDAHDRLRVTLDSRIRFCAPVTVGSECDGVEPRGVIAHGPAFVLELKLWDEPPVWLVSALRGVEEAVGFSKFAAGMRAAEECGMLGYPTSITVEKTEEHQLAASMGA